MYLRETCIDLSNRIFEHSSSYCFAGKRGHKSYLDSVQMMKEHPLCNLKMTTCVLTYTHGLSGKSMSYSFTDWLFFLPLYYTCNCTEWICLTHKMTTLCHRFIVAFYIVYELTENQTYITKLHIIDIRKPLPYFRHIHNEPRV